MKEKYDNRETRCKMLGHTVPFKYCRIMQNRLPCSGIMDCWFRMIPIEDFIINNYKEEEIQKFLTQPGPKINLILNMAEKAGKNNTKP